MNSRVTRFPLVSLVLGPLLWACVAAGPGAAPSSPSRSSGASMTAGLAAVSRSHPSAEADAALTRCQIDLTASRLKVTAMGLLSNPKDAVRFVGLTGREPQLTDTGPMWLITTSGELIQPSGDGWTDPVCAVTTDDALWYATGQIKDGASGKIINPLPAAPADMVLPSLAP